MKMGLMCKKSIEFIRYSLLSLLIKRCFWGFTSTVRSRPSKYGFFESTLASFVWDAWTI